MLKKTITYTDYNGNKRTEDFYFNLSKAELMEMELSMDAGMTNFLKKVIQTQQNSKLADLFKQLLLKSYGEKSDDGKRFVKNDELRQAFEQTEAYSELYMELATNAEAAVTFIKGVMPADLANQIGDVDVNNVTVEKLTEQLENKEPTK